MKYDTFHETLAGAVRHAIDSLVRRGIVLADNAIERAFESGGVSYGHTVEAHGEIATLKGKATKKWAHVTIYRMDSGRYELTVYVF